MVVVVVAPPGTVGGGQGQCPSQQHCLGAGEGQEGQVIYHHVVNSVSDIIIDSRN